MADLNEVGDFRNSPIGSARIVATATDNAEETMLSPVGAPAVASNPIVSAILASPAIELDSVVGDLVVTSIVHVDATSVGLQAVCIDVSRDWTTSVDLSHDVLVSMDRAIFRDFDHRVIRDCVCKKPTIK